MNKKSKTADELMAELQADPKWRAQQRAREKEWKELEEADFKEEAPIRHDLQNVGCRVSSVWDLVNSGDAYPAAIPILIKHLEQPHPDGVREGIVRALTCPEGRVAWKTLIEQFEMEKDNTTIGVKWALANAISVLVDADNVEDVLSLVMDRKHGKNRGIIVEAIKALDHPKVKSVLGQLIDDPDISPVL